MKTTLLTGNGAVENGWTPAVTALKRVIPDMPDEEPNLAFANLVYQLRWLSYQAREGNELREDAQKGLETRLRIYDDLKSAIAEEMTRAQRSGLIRPRPELKRIESRFFTDEVAGITTNWDHTIADFAAGRFQITYLHGDIGDPSSLYLPTEGIVEPYRPGSKESGLLGRRAAAAMSLLRRTERLIVYGLSLSPLDPELGIVISEGFHGTDKPREAIVVDLDPKAVARRLRYFLPRTTPYCFRPDEI